MIKSYYLQLKKGKDFESMGKKLSLRQEACGILDRIVNMERQYNSHSTAAILLRFALYRLLSEKKRCSHD
jgi:hypothetical protein